MPTSSSTPTRRTRQREATRRQLIQAGLRVVAAEGFAGASTAAIARATGKAHGTVFVHFPTRDALVAELVAEVGRAMSAQLAVSADGEPCAPARGVAGPEKRAPAGPGWREWRGSNLRPLASEAIALSS